MPTHKPTARGGKRPGSGKPRLRDDEPTVFYKIRVPASTHAKALRLGPERIRALIESAEE